MTNEKEMPIVAIMYDFDRTLSIRDMQEYQFIPSLGMEAKEFWGTANKFGADNEMDGILAYMYTMLDMAKKKEIVLTREALVSMGNEIKLFPGVESWFGRINEYGRQNGLKIEHYVISSGLREIIEGSSISSCLDRIYASEFYYDAYGVPVWPKLAVNYTNKTQFIYRINKGVLKISDDSELNKSMPDERKRVYFPNMIYIGDGLSDVPCMKMVKSYKGSSIAVYDQSKALAKELFNNDRVDYMCPADYTDGSELDSVMKGIIKKISAEQELHRRRDEMKKL